jgi:hypothetical protein
MDQEPKVLRETKYAEEDQEAQIEFLKRLPLTPTQLDQLLTELGCVQQEEEGRPEPDIIDYDDLKEDTL